LGDLFFGLCPFISVAFLSVLVVYDCGCWSVLYLL
jgi:hypothetical protein